MIRVYRRIVEDAIDERWPRQRMRWPERERLRRWLDTLPDDDALWLRTVIVHLEVRPSAPISAYLSRRWIADREWRRVS